MMAERSRDGTVRGILDTFDIESARREDAVSAIDASNADSLRAALMSAAGQEKATRVVDLSDTDICDSAALRELERAHQRARAEGGELRLVVSGRRLMRILQITGLNLTIPLYPTLTGAPGPGSCRHPAAIAGYPGRNSC
jgi:anti-anti-sigma factor